MAEPHVITALSRKRAELSVDIERPQHQLQEMIRDLEHLDRTLLLFDPAYEVASIKPKAFRTPADWSKRGEMSRVVLCILRKACEPLSTRDVAMQLIMERALDVQDEKLLRLMTKRVGVALREQRNRSAIASNDGPGMQLLWHIPVQKP